MPYDPRIAGRVRCGLVVWVLVLAGVGVACSGGGRGGGDGPTAAGPRRPGEVRIAVGEDIWPLTGRGPTSRHFAAGELNVGVYEPLLSLGSDYTVRPGLAERWELTGPNVWRFHLRAGVRFHDGRPLTADDVVWSWTGREALIRSVSATLESVLKVDDLTVDFVSSSPNLRLPEQLVHPEGPIVPNGAHNDSTPPIGTGPWKVVDYRPRRQVEVERFEGYWGAKPGPQRLVFRFLPDPELRVLALEKGEVDLVTGPPPGAVARIEAGPELHAVKARPGATQVLSFRATGPLGADRTVRQAVAMAVDRTRYVAEVLHGNGQPGRWTTPPSVLGPSAELVPPPTFDPERARRLLDDAGWKPGPDGTRVNGARGLDLVLIGGPSVPDAGLRLVAAQLKEIGVRVAVKKASDIVTYESYREKGYDLDLTSPNQNDANPAFLLSSRDAPDEEYAALAARSSAAPSREEVQRVAGEMMRALVSRDFTVVPLAGVSQIYGMRRGIDLADPHPSAINQTWTTLGVSR